MHKFLTQTCFALAIGTFLVASGDIYASVLNEAAPHRGSQTVQDNTKPWFVFELSIESERFFGPGKLLDIENDVTATLQSSLNELAAMEKFNGNRLEVIAQKTGRPQYQNQRRYLIATTFSQKGIFPSHMHQAIERALGDEIKIRVFDTKLKSIGRSVALEANENSSQDSVSELSVEKLLDSDGPKNFKAGDSPILWTSTGQSVRHPETLEKKDSRQRLEQFKHEQAHRESRRGGPNSRHLSSRAIERAVNRIAKGRSVR